jgi:hypothetical protein
MSRDVLPYSMGASRVETIEKRMFLSCNGELAERAINEDFE